MHEGKKPNRNQSRTKRNFVRAYLVWAIKRKKKHPSSSSGIIKGHQGQDLMFTNIKSRAGHGSNLFYAARHTSPLYFSTFFSRVIAVLRHPSLISRLPSPVFRETRDERREMGDGRRESEDGSQELGENFPDTASRVIFCIHVNDVVTR